MSDYSAPRLVEYHDPGACRMTMREMRFPAGAAMRNAVSQDAVGRARSLGVTIEAQYTVGEYDILILSAQQSNGLETWLRQNGYRIPSGASAVLNSYIKQNLKFFVAKVNLQEQTRLAISSLPPFRSPNES